jgi:hypothetical protein
VAAPGELARAVVAGEGRDPEPGRWVGGTGMGCVDERD